jgi:hypothetical protein
MSVKNRPGLNRPYLFGVLTLTFIFLVLSVFIEGFFNKGGTFSIVAIAKWFIFWAVGLRLFTARIRQTINPSFTAETIFLITNKDSHVIVRELRFANICFGLIGILSLFFPDWRIVSAFGSGQFYGIAGINHLIKKPAGSNEMIALVSDLFIFLCLLLYCLLGIIHASTQIIRISFLKNSNEVIYLRPLL